MKFPIRRGDFCRLLLLLAGATGRNSYLELGDGKLVGRFGLFFRMNIPLSGLESVVVKPNDWRLVWLKVGLGRAIDDLLQGRRNAVWGRGDYVVITFKSPQRYFFNLQSYKQILFGLDDAIAFEAAFRKMRKG
jgi:hypothetical protein